MARKTPDLTGRVIGRLLIVKLADRNKHNHIQYLCRCECGKEKTIPKGSLVNGYTKSCGCLSKETAGTLFSKCGGYSPARRMHYAESNAYNAMIHRCTNPKNPRFSRYGGRGIGVCARWLHGENGATGFECFLADVGKKPSPDLTLDRIDNDAGYFPDNCRWATWKTQANNKRDAWITRRAQMNGEL